MRGYACIGLDNPKNSLNVGSVLRAAGCYGAAFVAVGGQRPRRYMEHAIPTDTQRAHRHMPVMTTEDLLALVPYNCVPVAVDLIQGATPLPQYTHPERAFYIFGAEDATLDVRITEWCRDVVYVPTEHCMNLAATVNVILYDRLCKRSASRTQILRGVA